ncbi:carboxymuconolactone decarboxylase family protein [Arsenicicoccus piscis]|uniref:Carboxymuconolactone decarboxylase-like domain-containing protein n=1 Tax=Arsenicicoccus piscis TaxID=673954 RepID=A0ABQ6HVA9_9MICO|nr:hypothetical protein GCM10025862_40790 [Arsenicicoccus piscis]
MRRAKLDRRTSELVSIAVQSQQGCGMCLASHVQAARSLGVSEEEIELAHRGTSSDPAVAAIIGLGLQVYREPASITDAQIDELRALGYTDRAIADVVGVVSSTSSPARSTWSLDSRPAISVEARVAVASVLRRRAVRSHGSAGSAAWGLSPGRVARSSLAGNGLEPAGSASRVMLGPAVSDSQQAWPRSSSRGARHPAGFGCRQPLANTFP